MNRESRATILRMALCVLVALPCPTGCHRPGTGIAPEGEREAPPSPKKPFEAFLDSVPTTAPERRDAALWTTLRRFYATHGFTLAWAAPGITAPRAKSLLSVLAEAGREGLEPSDYPVRKLAERIDRRGPMPEEELFALDLGLSHAFLRYATDLSRGRLYPGPYERGWHIRPSPLDLVPAIESATMKEDPRIVLERLAPPHPEYARLRDALPRYREIVKSGGWPPVPQGPTLHPGETADAARLNAIEERLAREGYLQTGGEGERSKKKHAYARYDAQLSDGLRAFQRRHGLEPDGVIGAMTLAALNVPAETRARQIALNMERWRRMPAEMGARYIVVNVAGFRLEIYEKERFVTSMKVIVGMEGWGTPIFHADMTHVILHPAWRVPTSIAVKEILPKLRKDPSYLAENHMDVLRPGADGNLTVAAASVDWSKVSARNFPYRLRQRPGPDNPLGNFKFVPPNDYDVYLHDTSSPRLFQKDKRAFSHGCIRVERPMDLALWLLSPDPKWTRERLEEALKDPKTRRVDLREDVPVYITYWTAAVDGDEGPSFFPDLYALDAELDARLHARRR